MMAVLLFLASFVLYLTTACGTIPSYRDSGDLISAIFTLGIAHPPAYPLYVMCGHIFARWLPWANVAYRVNAFSAFCGASSVVLAYVVARCLVKSSTKWSAIVACGPAAVLYALSPAVVSLARVAEMYAMAACLAGAVIGCYVIGTSRMLALGWLLLGLGFGVHPTLMFLVPLLIPISPMRPGEIEEGQWTAFWKTAGIRFSCFLLGFFVVLFLPIRAVASPLQNWGNPSNWDNFWSVLTRGNYGGLKLHPTESQFSWTVSGVFQQVCYFFQSLRRQWGYLGLVMGAIGALWTGRRRKGLLVCWMIAGPLFFVLSNLPIHENTSAPILEPYLVLVNLIWALWVAVGLCALLERGRRFPVQAAAAVGLAGMAWILLPELPHSQRGYFYAYDLGRNMLRSLPPRAVLYDPDDPVSFTLRALQVTEGRRNDILLLNFFRTFWGYRQIVKRWPDLLPPGPVNNAHDLEQLFWNYSIRRRPFYVDLPSKLPSGIPYEVIGIVYHIPLSVSQKNPRRADDLFALYAWQGRWRSTEVPDFFTQHIISYYAAAHCNCGLEYANQKDDARARAQYRLALLIDPHLAAAYNNLGTLDFAKRQYARGLEDYRLAIRYDPENPGFWKNLGLAYQALGQDALAQEAFERAQHPGSPAESPRS
jgi:tetratricopeptide (TPR) repeat protein